MDRMKHKSHYILQLYVQKVSGTISEDDLKELENVLKEDAEMRAMCEEWDRDLSTEESKRQQDPELTNQRWQRIKRQYEDRGPERLAERRKARVVRLATIGSAAAAVVVLAIGISVFRTPEESGHHPLAC
ncbi:hypothetical protein MKQ70_05555 [Chitinophaga sedimenti]|uniref:hypothetical protein n=1 Tax=Chitinophaga sedimenti TaxID=2033606 RepID=UPI0020047DC4|nr:hypothetical protein [Chitinophaga sedimenti]MCK7554498.1 hypothetical protein [Chitinophaga sedimenti]